MSDGTVPIRLYFFQCGSTHVPLRNVNWRTRLQPPWLSNKKRR